MGRADLIMAACCVLAAAALLATMGDLPVFGDGWGYGYRSARWIETHGMQPVASGTGRGEMAMGHPTLMLWSWALLMRILGNTTLVAHLIPALMTALALWGTYRYGRLAGGRATGMWSSIILLCSPLFLAQSLQPLQDVGFTALAILAMTEYGQGRNTRAAVLTALATAFREQALLLAGSFILVELARNGLSKPGRLLIHLLSPGVFLLTGLGNLVYNGFFLFRNYLGEATELESGWFLPRLRFFAGHLLCHDGRWLPLTAGMALALSRQARKAPSVTAVLLLLAPAVLFPPGRLLFLAVMGAAGLLALAREGRMPDPAVLPAIVFIFAMIAFHVMIVAVAPDPQLNLYRYLLAAYPAVIVCTLALMRKKGGVRLLHPAGAITAALGVAACFNVIPIQLDATPMGLASVYDMRELARIAEASGDTVIAPLTEYPMFRDPALGFVDEAHPARILGEGRLAPGMAYTLLRPSTMEHDPDFDSMLSSMMVEDMSVTLLARTKRGEAVQSIFRLEPAR